MKLIFRKVQTWWGKDGKKHSAILPALKLSPSPFNRREFTKRGVLTVAVAGLAGPAFIAPSCGPSKEKAVKYASLVIELTKEALPLMDLLGSHDIAVLVNDKVIPALEKLKDALANADIPASESTLATVRGALNAAANALLNLPESARRNTILGILTSVNVLLLTIEAFVESEVQPTVTKTGATRASGMGRSITGDKILKAFEATRQ